jgi:hypothetical protein
MGSIGDGKVILKKIETLLRSMKLPSKGKLIGRKNHHRLGMANFAKKNKSTLGNTKLP